MKRAAQGFIGSVSLTVWALACLLAPSAAQQLDLDIYPKHYRPKPADAPKTPAATPSPTPLPDWTPTSLPGGKPLSATVSKTLYLPPAMYGQWSVVGTLIETNAGGEFFSPVVRDIWVLQREGDQVVISNPANGASANISVDKVEGDQATFHREGPAGRNRYFQEIPTITVRGDSLSGQSVNRLGYVKNGRVAKQYYAVYRLEATRISGARVQFRPEATLEDPDLEIEEVRRPH